MTNIEAINLLRGLEKSLDGYCELNDEGKKAFNMAVSALELFGNSEQLPSAQQVRTQMSSADCISRQDAIDALWEIRQEEISDGRRFHNHCSLSTAVDVIKDLPSAQPEIKPISYQDCANAMMMMWIGNVLTDGEYRRIMDKLNDHESRRENR